MENWSVAVEDPTMDHSRIPGKVELQTLRGLVDINQKSIQHHDRQLDDCNTRYNEIRHRYETQLVLLEEIKSELYAAERSVKIVQAQRAQSQSELDRLKGLLHPTRLLSSDVLRYIFELAVSVDEDKWTECAATIAQVCRRWRLVALEAPFLWHRFYVPRNLGAELFDSFLSSKSSRTKTIPPYKTIRGLKVAARTVQLCKFDQFPRIKYLQINVDRPVAAMVLNKSVETPKCQVDQLTIVGTQASAKKEQIAVLGSIIDTFKTTSNVTINSLVSSDIVSGPKFPHVVHLKLEHASYIPLEELPKGFPNVQSVEFRGSSFAQHDAGTITWRSIRSLVVERSPTLPWSAFNTPAIDNLYVGGTKNIQNNDLEAFISLHPSLRILYVSVPNFTLQTILSAAPNIDQLFFRPAICGVGDPKPLNSKNLTVLRIVIHDVNDLSLEALEKMVTRCILPGVAIHKVNKGWRFVLQLHVSQVIHAEWSVRLQSRKVLLENHGASMTVVEMPLDRAICSDFKWS